MRWFLDRPFFCQRGRNADEFKTDLDIGIGRSSDVHGRQVLALDDGHH